MTRSLRRHVAERAKARARRMLVQAWGWPRSADEVPPLAPNCSRMGPIERWYASPSVVGRYARTPRPCSCLMCSGHDPERPVSELRRVASVEAEP